MIVLDGVTKTYRANGRNKIILADANFTFPSRLKIALIGRNGTGKSTLLRLISGITRPDRGRILSDGEVSFPIGVSGSLHPDLTGAQNIKFVARLYGVDTDALKEFVAEFTELGADLYVPVRTYSAGMRSRLTFAINMGIPFDTYLIDEVTATGDKNFLAKSISVLRDKLSDASVIFVSHAPAQLRQFCEAGVVLNGGVLTYYDDVDTALKAYDQM